MSLKMIVLLAILKLALSKPDYGVKVNFGLDVNDARMQSGSDSLNSPTTQSNTTKPPPAKLLSLECSEDNTTDNAIVNLFAIKHWYSGKYIHTKDQSNKCGAHLVVNSGIDNNAYMSFDVHENSQWGHIRHVASGKYFTPTVESINPEDDTKLVLHSDRRPWGLFYLDQVNKHIVHIGGKYIHVFTLTAFPPDNTDICLYTGTHRNMEFIFVNTSNPHEVVPPYGDADITGDWRLFFSVENPLVSQTYSVEIKLGYSKSESVTSSSTFKFAWEVTANVRFWFSKMSKHLSTQLSNEITRSSSETWSSEITIKNEIEVVKGQPVAVWQKVFAGAQYGHRSVYQSDVYAHTNSSGSKPPGIGYTSHQFNLIY